MRRYKKYELSSLKAAIKGFELEARHIMCKNKGIKLKGKELYLAKLRKKELGQTARLHLLAYALMQGKKYSDVEPNKPLSKYNRWATSIPEKIALLCKTYGGVASPELDASPCKVIRVWLRYDINALFMSREDNLYHFKSKMNRPLLRLKLSKIFDIDI